MELPAPATSLLESKWGSSTNASQTEQEVKSDKSDYDKIKSEAVRENMDMTGGDVEFINEILPDNTEPSELDGVKEPQTVINTRSD